MAVQMNLFGAYIVTLLAVIDLESCWWNHTKMEKRNSEMSAEVQKMVDKKVKEKLTEKNDRHYILQFELWTIPNKN